MNKKIKGLAINSAVFAVNAFATKLISFVLVPLYTSRLTAAEYGLTDMSLTVISLLFPLVTLSIVEAAVRFMIAEKNSSNEYAAISFTVVVLSIALVSILSPVLDLPIFGGLGRYKGMFILAYASSALLSYFGEAARGAGEIKIIPVCATVSSLITLAITWSFMRPNARCIEVYFIAVSAGPLVASVIYMTFGHFAKKLRIGYSTLLRNRGETVGIMRSMLHYSLPLVPNSLFWWIGTSISRFFVTGIIGIAASGLYAAASKIPNLLNTVYTIFLQAWQLTAFEEQDEAERSRFFGSVFCCLQAIILVLCSLLSLLAPLVAGILIKGESYESWPLIGIMLLSAVGNIFSSFYGTVFTTTMNTSSIMSTTLKGSICCVVLTPLLTMPLGLVGACIASTLTQFVVLIARMIRAKELVSFDPNYYALIPSLGLLTLQAYMMLSTKGTSIIIPIICFCGVVMIQLCSMVRLLLSRRAAARL